MTICRSRDYLDSSPLECVTHILQVGRIYCVMKFQDFSSPFKVPRVFPQQTLSLLKFKWRNFIWFLFCSAAPFAVFWFWCKHTAIHREDAAFGCFEKCVNSSRVDEFSSEWKSEKTHKNFQSRHDDEFSSLAILSQLIPPGFSLNLDLIQFFTLMYARCYRQQWHLTVFKSCSCHFRVMEIVNFRRPFQSAN